MKALDDLLIVTLINGSFRFKNEFCRLIEMLFNAQFQISSIVPLKYKLFGHIGYELGV